MNKRENAFVTLILTLVFLFLCLLFYAQFFNTNSFARVHSSEIKDGVLITEAWRIREGGRLYANWANELEKSLPKRTHPAYPSVGKQKGSTTWRCKECHGWDYNGSKGAYGSGSHYTGIKGIRSYAKNGTKKLQAILVDNNHKYTPDMLTDDAIKNLTYFLGLGLINMDAFIDRKTKKVYGGNTNHGAEIFQTVCSVCHGLDGRLLNFESEKNPEYVGTAANENPWETLHNIRFGHSGDAMIGLFAFPIKTQIDVLTYLQTLPRK